MSPRGGYQAPRDKTPRVSGAGKHSRRTDNQPIQVANVGDSEELQHGDRQRLEASQRVAPLSRASQPRVAPPSAAAPRGGGGGGAQLPPYVFGAETTRPDEPITEGLPFGPGSGPEVLAAPTPQPGMEEVLQFVIEQTGDQGIAQMLSEHREFKAWRNERQAPVPKPLINPASPAPEEGFEPDVTEEFAIPDTSDLATEDAVAVEGEEETLSVETPEAAPATETAPEIV